MPAPLLAGQLALATLAAHPAPVSQFDMAFAGYMSAKVELAPEPEVPLPGPGATEEAITTPPPIDNDPAAPRGFSDPLEPINRISYAITQPIDRFVFRPAAMTYQAVVPKPLRDGARNAISNLGEPVVLLNDLVQLRPKRALRTLVRLAINSTIGAFGLFDIAKRKPFHIEHHDNGFGSTLGLLGIGPIAYIYLPVLGPNTLRDLAGNYGDAYFQDRNLHKLIHPGGRSPYFRTKPRLGQWDQVVTVVSGLDQRAESDTDLRAITEDSVDPYAALRSSYLQDRAGEIAALKAKDGEAPKTEGLNDPLTDPAAGE